MKSIEIFNETNSNLIKAVNMAFEVTLRRIEEASKVGRTHTFKKIFKAQKSKMV